MHKTPKTLRKMLEDAAGEVVVGGSYRHYKNPGDHYSVLHLAITERDDEVAVIYLAQYGENLIFVRPLSNWIEEVEWQGAIVKRFTAVKGI